MKKTVKKGFTLVELLVVIAILAILATVSVVGYTAFIERATVSNDENVAAQLNQFLTAMKADSTGKYYNETITPKNVWEVIDAALKENGTLTDLDPQSKDYGYHYFFKFNKNGENYEDGEIVVAKKADIITKTAKGFFAAHAIDPATDEYGVGFFTAEDSEGNEILYFFLDTKGSSLATAINALQNIPIKGWERIEGSTTDEKIKNAIQAVADAKTETNGKADYTDLLNNTRFVNKEGQIATTDNANGNIIFIEENASAGDTVTVVAITNESGTPALRKFEPVPAQPLNPSDDTTITVPAGAQISAGALNVAEDNDNKVTDKVTIVIETGSLSDIATSEGNPGTIEAGFTNSTNVEIKVDNDNNSYTVKVKTETDGTKTTVIVKVESEGGTTETGHQLGTGLFPMRSFKITANNVDKKTDIRSNDSVYVAVDINGGISFDIKNIEGVSGKPVSKGNVEYEITGMTVEGVDTVTNWDTYATLTGNKIEFKMDENGYYHKINTITIKATAEKPYEGDTKATAEYTIYVVRPTGISSTLGGEEPDTDGVFTLGNAQVTYDESGRASKVNSTFTFSSQINTYNRDYDESNLTFDNTTTLLSNTNFTYGTDSNGNSTITLIKDVQTTDESGNTTTTERFAITDAEITVNVGSFFQKTYKVTLYDQCQLAWNKTNSNIRYLGNEGAKLNSSVILARNDSVEKPEGAQLYVFSGTGDAPEYPCKSSAFTIVSEKTPDEYEKTVYVVEYTYDDEGNIAGTSIIFGEGVTAETSWKIAWAVRTTNDEGESEYEIVSDMYDIRAVPALNLVNGQNPEIGGTEEEPEYVFKTDGTTVASGHKHDKSSSTCTANNYNQTTTKNLVLLEDYHLTSNQYIVLNDSVLYGNLFTLDVTNARNNSIGIVNLVGSSMYDTKVIAKEYGTTEDPWYSEKMTVEKNNFLLRLPYQIISGITKTDPGRFEIPISGAFIHDATNSAAAVRVFGGSKSTKISNCYIAYGRSPLRVEKAGTEVSDTVLFGGSYANLDIQEFNGTITLNNVITVNQYQYDTGEKDEDNNTVYTRAKLFGGGIVVANAKENSVNINITGEKGLQQFNFISSEQTDTVIKEGTITIADVAKGTFSDDLTGIFEFGSDPTYFSAAIISLKTTEDKANKEGHEKLNITINGVSNFPTGYTKNAYGKTVDLTVVKIPMGVAAASFGKDLMISREDMSEEGKAIVTANLEAFKMQYGFDFSVDKFISEASKYHPDNIGKKNCYNMGYLDNET